MSTIPASRPDAATDRLALQPETFLISIPDAERMAVQSRFVRSPLEAEILSDIEERIRRGAILEPFTIPKDLVTMNSQVVLRDRDTDQRYIFTLVFPVRANFREGRLSVLTPLGSILLGARTGQSLTCLISGAIATVVIEAILHQPEACGDYFG